MKMLQPQDGQNKEKGETDTKSQPEVGTSSVQTVFKPATRNHSPPAKKYKEEDMVNLEPVGDHVVKLEQTSAPNIAKMAGMKLLELIYLIISPTRNM